MPELLLELLKDPLTYVLGAVVFAARIYADRRISRGVDHRFDERLETHKQALQVETERARFDFQKQMADVTLYATKRHGAAGDIYAAVREAHGRVAGLFGLARTLTFEEFNEQDIAAYMTSREVPKGQQVEILTFWLGDRALALKLLRPYLRMLDVQDAERLFDQARNITYQNELYLSDLVIAALSQLFNQMADWLSHAVVPVEPGEKWGPDRAKLDERLELIHDLLRAELGTGTFHQPAYKQTNPHEA